MLLEDILQEPDALVAAAYQEETMMTWLYRLGHMSKRGLKVLVERNLLHELKMVKLPFCDE
jgi:hypothetical protein